jgi:hypothetical protein
MTDKLSESKQTIEGDRPLNVFRWKSNLVQIHVNSASSEVGRRGGPNREQIIIAASELRPLNISTKAPLSAQLDVPGAIGGHATASARRERAHHEEKARSGGYHRNLPFMTHQSQQGMFRSLYLGEVSNEILDADIQFVRRDRFANRRDRRATAAH